MSWNDGSGPFAEVAMVFALIFAGFVIGAATAFSLGGLHSRGLRDAVACQPVTYLQTLNSGDLLCVGGKGETWRVKK